MTELEQLYPALRQTLGFLAGRVAADVRFPAGRDFSRARNIMLEAVAQDRAVVRECETRLAAWTEAQRYEAATIASTCGLPPPGFPDVVFMVLTAAAKTDFTPYLTQDHRTPEARKWSDDFIPPQTCPAIDSIQNQLEHLRDANSQLRHAAYYWKRIAEERATG